jgi:transposase
VVLNPRRVRLIAESTLKSDTIDAEILARLSRFDLKLLRPVYQRSEAAQELRTRLRVRGSLVKKARTSLINSVRGSLRSRGYRMGSCPTSSFVARWFELRLAPAVREVLEPLVETIAELTDRIAVLERELKAASRSDELMLRLQDVPGVGPLVSLAYVGWMDRAERFAKSRDVGACLGLRPRVRPGRCHASTSKILPPR